MQTAPPQASRAAPSLRTAPEASAPLAPSIDALARRTSRELEALFAAASWAPADFAAVAGHPQGRVLAVPGLDRSVLGALVRGIHASALYPWQGKSFATRSESEGRGINRFRLPVHGGFAQFETRQASSLVDGRPCLAIDYDVPENVALLRGIYDELRAVGDGLYLGRGMHRRRNKSPALMLWFAVETRVQDRAVRV